VLLTLLFLLVTIYQSTEGGYELWKSSAVVPLQVLDGDTMEELSQWTQVSEYEKQVEEMKVFFNRGGEVIHEETNKNENNVGSG
jgi:hypothetical protein